MLGTLTLLLGGDCSAPMAQQLIGVTMQEQGVSRIVAVDMESALSMAELS